MGILDWKLRETSYAVVNMKTTGLTPSYDRVCEISIVRVEPRQPLKLSLDTLVHPGRPLAGTEVHGISDEDCEDAPTLTELVNPIVREFANRVVVAFNVQLLQRFLDPVLEACEIETRYPYIDLMALDGVIRGNSVSLTRACASFGIEASMRHISASGALDGGKLLRALLTQLSNADVDTFGALRRLEAMEFPASFRYEPLALEATYRVPECIRRISRYEAKASPEEVTALSSYFDELLVVLEDMVITDVELERLKALKAELQLDQEQVDFLHARVFAGELVAIVDQGGLASFSRKRLQNLRNCLHTLGWAPGD